MLSYREILNKVLMVMLKEKLNNRPYPYVWTKKYQKHFYNFKKFSLATTL